MQECNFMTILCEQFLIQYPVTVFHFFGIMFFGMFQILFTKFGLFFCLFLGNSK